MRRLEFDQRESGIRLVSNLSWGTHYGLFYQTKNDLLEILIPYFRAGLLNNEFCVWVSGEPLEVSEVKTALERAVPDFEKYKRSGQLEIIPSQRWPVARPAIDKIISAKIDRSLFKNFNGLRLACKGPYGLEAVARYNALAVFNYPRDNFDAIGFMELVKKHQFALVRNAGKWELIKSSQGRVIKDALKRSEEKLRSVFNNISEGFAYHRIALNDKGKPCDYIFLEVNKAFEKLTGLKARNIIGRRVTEVLPGIEKDPTDWIAKFGKVALSGKPVHFESYAQAFKRWYAVSAFSPYKGFFAATLSDITERKEYQEQLVAANEELSASNEELRVETEERQRIEEDLKEKERRLNKSQEIARLGSWELNVINNRLYWSDEVYRIFGLKPQEFKATYEAFLERVHPDDRKAVDAAYSGSIREGRHTYEIEHRVVKKSTGEIRYVHEKCEHIRDESGRIIRSAGMVQDITERKRAEEKIVHLASFPQANPNPIIEIDADGKVIFSNLSCIKTLEALKVPKKISLFFPEDLSQILKDLHSQKKTTYTREIKIKDSAFIETLVVLPELKVVRIYARDITQRKLAEEALKQAHDKLEVKVAERTEELTDANQQLIKEILQRKEIEKQLRARSAILKIMGRASNRQEYLDILVRYIKALAGCHYVGLRVLNEKGEIPYESYIGFSREFWERENRLSVNRDQCACIRIITGNILPQDKPCISKAGSFVTNNSTDFLNSLVKKETALYRGTCIQSGFSSIAVVPLEYKNKIIAAVHLADERKDMFPAQKIEFLELLTPLIAEGINKFDIEDRMQQASQRVIYIIESLSDGFFALDRDWRFTYVNSAAEHIMGVRREDLLGKVIWDVFPETKNSKIYEEYHHCMIHKIPASFDALLPYVNKWMDVHLYPYEGGISVYFKDISEKKSGEEKLKEAQNQLERIRRLSDIGALAATVAHELRNPLAAMRMAAFNIKRKAQNPLLDKHLLNIEKKISESDQIINNLLFYSRLKQPHYENVDLYKIMEECVEIAKKRAVKTEVKVTKKYRILRRLLVDADPLQMKELFSNILNNAYDAIQENPGSIEIGALREKDGPVEIYFKDSGVGMDEEHLKHCHEPFFTTKAKGTGLGLSVCFQIVNLHNGGIELSSQKGEGTTVRITLPVKK